MAYTLRAIIGREEELQLVQKIIQGAEMVPLTSGLLMIPLTRALADEMNKDEAKRGAVPFDHLTDHMESTILAAIGKRKLAYVESEFFGGQGGHAGVVWTNGRRAFVGEFGVSTMNDILKRMGVNRSPEMDEFETAGLSRHRHTEQWMQK